MKLYLGTEQKEGFINVTESDLAAHETASVEEFICDNYIHRCENVISLIDRIYELLQPAGKLIVTAPYYASFEATLDPRTKRVISEATFLVFNKEWREKNLKDFPINADFDYGCAYLWNADWEARSDEAKAFAVKHYMNVIKGLQVVMTKK